MNRTIVNDLCDFEELLENMSNVYYIECYFFEPTRFSFLFLNVNNELDAIDKFNKYINKNNCLNASLSFKGKEESNIILNVYNGKIEKY